MRGRKDLNKSGQGEAAVEHGALMDDNRLQESICADVFDRAWKTPILLDKLRFMNTSPKLLWLDDERDPSDSRWHEHFPIANPTVLWLRSFEEFVEWVTANSLPNAVCFDHDLGNGPGGLEAAKWLTNYCLEKSKPLPAWSVHSANPVGKENITALLASFERAAELPY